METTSVTARHPAAGIGDAERDACLHELGALYDAGAMTMEELDTRVCAAMLARSAEELTELVSDLMERLDEPESPPAVEARSEPVPDDHRNDTAVASRAGGLSWPVALVAAGTVVIVAGSVLLGSVLPVVVLISALVGSFAMRALGRRSVDGDEPADRPGEPTAVETTPSQDLALLPRPTVPAQRMPGKVHPVIVPIDEELELCDLNAAADAPQKVIVPSVRELPSAERRALGAGCAPDPADVGRCDLPAPVDEPVDQDRVPDLVSSIRPLFDRVTDRAWLRQHGRRGQAAPRVRSS